LKIKGILFDMDGTVLDSEALFEEGQVLLLEEYNVKEED
jgi:beta-phosphoglucomutase-like phosphatase (HAD superfamily)